MQRFAAELRELRERAGRPGYRQMSRAAHFSVTTLSDAAGGERFPSLAVTLAYVRVCGGDVVAWQARWRAVAAELARQRPAADPPSGVATGGVEGSGGVRCPYPGMAPFGPDDAAFFRGRQRLITAVVAKLAVMIRGGGGPLVVVGSSGVGKSSLLRAGVLPALAAGEVPAPGVAGWPQLYLRPGADPLGALAAQLDAAGVGEPGLAAAVRAEPAALRRVLRGGLDRLAASAETSAQTATASAPEPGDWRVVIVVDQVEELFTHGSSESDRVALVRALIAASEPAGSEPSPAVGACHDFCVSPR